MFSAASAGARQMELSQLPNWLQRGKGEVVGEQDAGAKRLMSVPGIGPIISSAIVAAIGTGDAFSKGRDFAAWLGLVPRQIRLVAAPSSERSPSAAIATCAFSSLRRHGCSW